MDASSDPQPDDEPPPMPTEAELRQMMDRSDDDVAAGRIVPIEDVLVRLERRIVEMEARQRPRRT